MSPFLPSTSRRRPKPTPGAPASPKACGGRAAATRPRRCRASIRCRCYRRDGWTPERQVGFIRALAESGCVAEACRRVGLSAESAYELARRPDAQSFRIAWDIAMDNAVRRVGDGAFSRAINGTEIPHFYKGELVGTHRRYDERLTMFILRTRDPDRFGRRAETAERLHTREGRALDLADFLHLVKKDAEKEAKGLPRNVWTELGAPANDDEDGEAPRHGRDMTRIYAFAPRAAWDEEDEEEPEEEEAGQLADELRAGDDLGRLGHRRASRRRARRGRADRGAPLRVRHAARPADLGRRPPGLSAQDPHRPPRPHPHPAPGRRPVGFTKRSRANTTRSARRTARPRSRPRSASRWRASCRGANKVIAVIGDGAMSAGMAYEAMNNAGAGNRAGRHPQRQRHVDRAAGGRAVAYLARLVSSANI
jgi:hypothetical protein